MRRVVLIATAVALTMVSVLLVRELYPGRAIRWSRLLRIASLPWLGNWLIGYGVRALDHR